MIGYTPGGIAGVRRVKALSAKVIDHLQRVEDAINVDLDAVDTAEGRDKIDTADANLKQRMDDADERPKDRIADRRRAGIPDTGTPDS